MERETSLGPLSYDVTTPDRDPSAQRGIILGLLTTAAAWIVAMVAGWFVLGFLSDPRVVTTGFPLAVVLLALAATYLGTRRSTARARRNGLAVVLGASLLASFMSASLLGNVKPTIPQVRQALDDVSMPRGFRVLSETTHGDRFCRRGCPTVERVYQAPESDPDPVRTMILRFFAEGWQRTSDVEPELASSAQQGSIFVHLAETLDGTVEMTATRQS